VSLLDFGDALPEEQVAPTLAGRYVAPEEGPAPEREKPETTERAPWEGYKGPPAAPGRITGRIVGPDGKPIGRVQIVIDRLDASGAAQRGEGFPKYWGAGKSGWFRVDDLPAGTYALRISAKGHAERWFEVQTGHEPMAVTLQAAVALAGKVLAEDRASNSRAFRCSRARSRRRWWAARGSRRPMPKAASSLRTSPRVDT
jgi:hypothetical protein